MLATAIRRRPSTVEYGTLFHCRHNATNRRVKVGHEMKLNSTFPEYWTTLKTAGCYSGEQYHQCSQLMRRHIGRHRHSNIGNHWHPYTSFQWRSQDLEVGAQGVWETEVPSGVQGQSPWWVVRGGSTASRKLIAVIKDIWLPNHAQFCVFSSTAQPGIFS